MSSPRVSVIVLALVSGCAAGRRGGSTDSRATGSGAFTALLLNGGGWVQTNYHSHARHLVEMRETLLAGGVDDDSISVLSSDGDNPGADLSVRHMSRSDGSRLLEGTVLDGPLRAPTRFHNTHLEASFLDAATKRALASRLETIAEDLRAGDTFLLFVTDHGERGSRAKHRDGAITMWGRESLTVSELARLLDPIDPGVRTVMVMSQCYSGAFADVALDAVSGRRSAGSTCGFFSTTEARQAYGCYPESRTATEDDGHAFRFIRALRHTGSFSAAHARTLIDDTTPDVPLRTSDVFLARAVERRAGQRGVDRDALVAAMLQEGLNAFPADASRVAETARAFGLAVPANGADLTAQESRLEATGKRFDGFARIWEEALGDLAQANLDEFFESKPAWKERLAPTTLARIGVVDLFEMENQLSDELTSFTAAHPERTDSLRVARGRLAVSRAVSNRSDVRRAALLRLKVLTTSIVGRLLLAREGSPEEQQTLQRLFACEDSKLPATPAPPAAAGARAIFPTVEHDEGLARTFAPSVLGVVTDEVPVAETRAHGWPRGAARVLDVASGSVAAAPDVRPGDVILGAPEQPLRDGGGLKLFVASAPRGQPLRLMVDRAGKSLTVEARPAPPPDSPGHPELPAAVRAGLRSLATHRGDVSGVLKDRRPYLLFFWATWCKFCKEAVPELLSLERALNLPVVAITDEPRETVQQFLATRSEPFPQVIALDTERRLNEVLDVNSYPTFLHVDAGRRLRSRSTGYNAARGLEIEGWRPDRR